MILRFFETWVGWGWGVLFLAWFGGTAFILSMVHRWFIERYATRLPTAVIFILWTLAIIAIGGKTMGYGPPPG